MLNQDVSATDLDILSAERRCDGMVVGPGCPCNATRGADRLACDAGSKCVPSNWVLNDLDRLVRPMETLLGRVCQRCVQGEYCPIGSLGEDDTGCPKGFHCPDPSVTLKCDPGTFCSERMIAPQSCDYQQLLMNSVYVLREQDTVLDRLTRYGDPLKGNYCPTNATTPARLCQVGHYCPNASVSLACPEGTFCKEGSVWPRPCPGMTWCPAGTGEPSAFGGPLLFAGLVLLVVSLVKVMRWWISSSFSKPLATATAVTGVGPEVHVVLDGAESESPYETYVLSVRGRRTSREEPRRDWCEGVLGEADDAFLKAMLPFKRHVRPCEYIGVRGISARSGPNKEPWLWENSVSFPCGRMSAIMGASGCGKSVTLDLMRGRVPKGAWVTGSVHVRMLDGEKADLHLSELERGRGGFEISKLQSFCGFVPQDDIVHGDLTVWENLLYSALIKLPPSVSRAERTELIRAVVRALGLEKIRDSLVGSVDRRGISGGQRKRVNVGVEMVGLPSILMMDEPTSGLDATMTLEFLRVCNDLTELGMTLLCVIHQPRYGAYMMFDHVLLLTKFGTVFAGSPAMSIAYFKHGLNEMVDVNENPADALIDIIGKKQEALNEIWKTKGWLWVQECERLYPGMDTAMAMDVRWNEDVRTIIERALDATCGDGDVLFADQLKRLFTSLGVPTANVHVDVSRREFLNMCQRVCENGWLEKRYDNIVERIDLLDAVRQRHVFMSKEDEAQQVRAATLALRFGHTLMKRVGIARMHHEKRGGSLSGYKNEMLLMVMNVKGIVCRAGRQARLIEATQQVLREGSESALEFFVLSAKRMWGQVPTVVQRKLVSLWRSPWPIQVLVPVAGAFIIGGIQGAGWGLRGYPSNVVMAMACVGVLSAVTHVRTYAMDRAVVRRETDGPLSITACTLSYALVDFLWLFLMPMLFVVPYYYFTLPQTGFWVMYAVALMVCWWNSGMAYVVSALPLGMQWVNLIAVFISVIFGAFIHGLSPSVSDARGSVMEWVLSISYNRWAMEVLTLYEMDHHRSTASNQVWLLMTKLGVCGEHPFDATQAEGAKGALMLWNRMNALREKSVVVGCDRYIATAFGALLGWGFCFRLLCYVVIVLDSNTIVQRTVWYARTRVLLLLKRVSSTGR